MVANVPAEQTGREAPRNADEGLACPCGGGTPPSRPHWIAEVLRWAIPGGALALMPKCPACVAGYIALFTGLGVSLSLAAQLRWAIITLCATWLGWMAIRRLRSRLQRRHPAVRRDASSQAGAQHSEIPAALAGKGRSG